VLYPFFFSQLNFQLLRSFFILDTRRQRGLAVLISVEPTSSQGALPGIPIHRLTILVALLIYTGLNYVLCGGTAVAFTPPQILIMLFDGAQLGISRRVPSTTFENFCSIASSGHGVRPESRTNVYS
jgi:hypothetical protein